MTNHERVSHPRLPRRATLALAACVAAVWAVAGCGEASLVSTDPDTGLLLTVLRGPVEPVAEPGEPNTEPVADAELEIVRQDGPGRLLVATSPSGMARVNVPPGTYRVSVQSCPGALALPQPVTLGVEAGRLTAAQLVCDTGIR